jgi:acetolactate synthase-1/2/3 large subunit
MTEQASVSVEGHGGQLALAALKPFGVAEMFTLSGGHVFPLYDAARADGVKIVDVRHEQSAVFAAEAVAKLQRRPGLAVLTAGPGVTNGVSGITSAYFNGSPVIVLGGRAPLFRWGAGSLQEIDHVPLVAPVTKHAATVTATADVASALREAALLALRPHRGPVFLDFPLDVIYDKAAATVPTVATVDSIEPDPGEVAKAAALLAAARRALVKASGLGRGSLPPGHPLAFTRARRAALKGADVVAVVGTPLDFRLNFGDFGEARVVHIVDAPSQRATHVTPAVSPAGDLRVILSALADHPGGIHGRAGGHSTRADHQSWIDELRQVENAARAAEAAELEADTDPIKPSRVYGELRKILDPDAVTIGDGGDFVSYAGRYLEPARPGTWLDPGPYGCLGTGMGYAIGARLTYPDRQVCVLLGDGAAGFSLMDVETLVRHKLPVVMVVGNNGIWGLEKHPMQALYGYDVAADLQPGLRYDAVVEALGGAGETVSRPADLGPALRRAFDAGVPYLVNVLTDPADQYPRSSSLA